VLGRGLTTAALVAMLGAFGVTASPASAVPSSTVPAAEATALAMRVDSPAGAYGAIAVSDPAQLTVRQADGGLAVAGISVAADMYVVPAAGERLSVGTFPAAGPGTASAAGTVLVSAGKSGGSCIIEAGTPVRLLEAVYSPQGNVDRLAVDVNGRCSGSEAVHELRLRYRSTAPYLGIGAPVTTDLGLVPLAYPVEREVVVRVEGSTPVVFGVPRVEVDPSVADRASDITVVDDTCRNSTLVGGQQCRVRLRAAPTHKDHLVARLVLPDNTQLGRSEITQIHLDGWPRSTGTYYPVAYRALDTRTQGSVAAAGSTKVVAIDPTLVPVPDTSAVVATVTVIGAVQAGFVTAYSGNSRPPTSSLNFTAGETRANQVTIPTTPEGAIRFYTSAPIHLVVDIVGYYAANDSVVAHKGMGSQFSLLESRRILDTRSSGAVRAGGEATLILDLPGFNDDASAIAVNVTAVGPTRSGYLQAWEGRPIVPTTSMLNFARGATVAGSAIVPLQHQPGAKPSFTIRNGSTGATHVLVDVVGIYFANHPAGLRYRPVAPTRIVDTRAGLGGFSAKLPAGRSVVFSTPSQVLGNDTEALVGTVAAVAPTLPTFLTVWEGNGGVGRPTTSTLNALAGRTVANSLVVDLIGGASTGTPLEQFTIYNDRGQTHAILDVAGTFEAYPPFASGGSRLDYAQPHLGAVEVSHG
jgi:hypothetical protein